MERQPVKSSSIKSIGYDQAAKKMHIEFASGAVYEYPDIERHEHAALVNAPSVGAHFSKNIRPKRCKIV